MGNPGKKKILTVLKKKKSFKSLFARDRELAANCDVALISLKSLSEETAQMYTGSRGLVFFGILCCISAKDEAISQQPRLKKKRKYAGATECKLQREGIWTDEQILAAGGNCHQAGDDLPLPYAVITCRVRANWQRTTTYGFSSPPPARSGSVDFTVS